MKIDKVLKYLKLNIVKGRGEELRKFILIGSRVADLEKDNSDIDIIVITNDLVDTYEFIKDSSTIISDIFSKYGAIVGIYPIKESNYYDSKSQFISNIITKGIEF